MRRLLGLALALLLVPAAAQAREREMVEVREGQPVSIRPDRAYILFRTLHREGAESVEPIFLRIPTTAEMARHAEAKRQAFLRAEPALRRRREQQLRRQAEAQAAGRPFRGEIPPPPSVETFDFTYDEIQNVDNVDDRRPFVRGRQQSVYLVEVPPGDYVLYGVMYGSPVFTPTLMFCMCLGTVGFPARAGEVTDLGHFLGDMVERVSSVPELSEESGFGPSGSGFLRLLGATVRPAPPGLAVPAALGGATVVAADYRAIGTFFDPRAGGINRLAPVPGVLAYDGARIIDVKSGTEARGAQ